MKNLKHLDKFRVKHPFLESLGDDYNGAFQFKINGNRWSVIASNGGGWDHVSLSLDKKRTPTWEEMCKLKSMFFRDDETVVQFHPAKVDHINLMNNCLHLWRSHDDHNLPPQVFV